MIDDPLNRLSVKRGSQLPHAKLNEEQVSEILYSVDLRNRLRERASTLSNKALAKKYGVHYRTIERVVQGETWGYVL